MNQSENLTAVELFAGIGGFRIACDKIGIKTVWANDISPKASKVYVDRFGSNEHNLGDFNEIKSSVPKHDLLTGGFPCQPFSSAGKKHGIRDVRGTLFQLIAETVDKHRPKFFVLENVKRLLTMEKGAHFATILSTLVELGYLVEWRIINAMNVGLPQNRERVFIVGTRIEDSDSFEAEYNNVLPTKLLTSEDLLSIPMRKTELLFRHSHWKTLSDRPSSFGNWGIAFDGRFFTQTVSEFSDGKPLRTLKHVLQDDVDPSFDFTESTEKWIDQNTVVDRLIHGVEIISNQEGGRRMGYTIFGINGVAPTLTSTTSRHYERYKVGDRYRRLTNVEYARIQGFPDDHCSAVSVYDQYALFGNAVPPPMAGWILGRLSSERIPHDMLLKSVKTPTLFDYAY